MVDGQTKIISGLAAYSTPAMRVGYSNIETVGGKPTTLVQTTKDVNIAGSVTLSANPSATFSSGSGSGSGAGGSGGGAGGGSATTTNPVDLAGGASRASGGLRAVDLALAIAVGVGVVIWMS